MPITNQVLTRSARIRQNRDSTRTTRGSIRPVDNSGFMFCSISVFQLIREMSEIINLATTTESHEMLTAMDTFCNKWNLWEFGTITWNVRKWKILEWARLAIHERWMYVDIYRLLPSLYLLCPVMTFTSALRHVVGSAEMNTTREKVTAGIEKKRRW